jgi:hypothetical protein
MRSSYEPRPFTTPDQKPVQRPDLDDLQTNAGKPLQPRCWRCFAPVQECKCGGL